MAKVMAESWKGGMVPDAAVIRARKDHIRIAVNPISVALVFMHYPFDGARPLALTVERLCGHMHRPVAGRDLGINRSI